MLVLSRKLGDCIVLGDKGDEIVATVTVIGREFVELRLTRLDGSPLGTAAVGPRASSPIVSGVWGRVIRIETDKVRLGLESSPGFQIQRGEDSGPSRRF